MRVGLRCDGNGWSENDVVEPVHVRGRAVCGLDDEFMGSSRKLRGTEEHGVGCEKPGLDHRLHVCPGKNTVDGVSRGGDSVHVDGALRAINLYTNACEKSWRRRQQ